VYSLYVSIAPRSTGGGAGDTTAAGVGCDFVLGCGSAVEPAPAVDDGFFALVEEAAAGFFPSAVDERFDASADEAAACF
jgi:hypothetical protein